MRVGPSTCNDVGFIWATTEKGAFVANDISLQRNGEIWCVIYKGSVVEIGLQGFFDTFVS